MGTSRFPPLPRRWKGRYPFRLGTTSFIYPADYLPNVERLAPCVDEIELLMFASGPEDRPSRQLVRELAARGADLAVTYNVHLPTDVCLGAADAGARRRAVETLRWYLERVAPLAPTVHVLHLELEGEAAARGGGAPADWLARTAESLEVLLAATSAGTPLAVEVLDYPFAWVEPLVERLNLAVCLDAGHLAAAGKSIRTPALRHRARLPILHLHGTEGGRDHLSLEALPPWAAAEVREILADFRGTVSLEVFGLEALRGSLEALEALWGAGAAPGRGGP